MYKTGHTNNIEQDYVLSDTEAKENSSDLKEDEIKQQNNSDDSTEVSYYDSEIPAAIIDNGSGFIKAGYRRYDEPKYNFECCVGRPRARYHNAYNRSNYHIGNEAILKKSVLDIKYPINNGFITNWDDMQKIWNYTISNKLGIDINNEYELMLTINPTTIHRDRCKMAEIAFESLLASKLYLAIDATLALYSTGRTTGCVLSSGYERSYCVPIYEGYCITPHVKTLDIAGKHLNEYLCNLLTERGYHFQTNSHFYIAQDIKEKWCYIPLNINTDCALSIDEIEKEFELPDGNKITIGYERCRCTEILFKPTLIGYYSIKGIHELLYDAIKASDIDIHNDLFNNIVLCGGNTFFNGFQKRILKEMERLTSKEYNIRVIAPDERKYSVWIGGSILCSLSAFQEMWITKKEYEECGNSIIDRKCL